MARVIFNRKISSNYYRMRILCPEIASRAKPGQFIMVRITELLDPLLRRPFGIHRLCHERDKHIDNDNPSCIEILYKIVGKGTIVLSEKKKDEGIDLMGPLGSGFYLEQDIETAVIVAGGIGVAPLFPLAQVLKGVKDKNTFLDKLFVFIGGENREDILCLNDFKKIGARVAVSTIDGSLGTKGLVTDLIVNFLRNLSPLETQNLKLFGCGPLPMLRTLSEIAFCKDIPCQVSLESRMACGVGACQGCAVPTEMNKEGDRAVRYQRACKEGPVFDSNIIFWDYKSILLKV